MARSEKISGLVRDLESLVERKRVLVQPEDLVAYTNDATHKRIMPAAVILPREPEEVAAVLKYADQKLIPVVPRGAGTGLSGGATPVEESLVQDLKLMNQVIEVDQGNLTATVECGVVTQKFHQLVESMGLFYPPDPQSMSVCTLGGNVATRAGGPRGVKYGTTKDYVLGLEAVLPDGSIIGYGGKSVKMSSGYDLARLLTGSEGTLGVITKINLGTSFGITLNQELSEAWFKFTGGCKLYEAAYGLSETHTGDTFMPASAVKWGTQGVPTYETSIRIVDPDTGDDKTPGEG